MKKIFLILLILFLLAALAVVVWRRQSAPQLLAPAPAAAVMQVVPMTITSSAFADNQPIPAKYTCDADGINPPLQFAHVPQGAQSLLLAVTDPDAPSGTWVHWLVWNLDPSLTGLDENAVPAGAVQGRASSGQNVYSGPCPPSGTHHYLFTLYALDEKLDLPSYSTWDKVGAVLSGHVLGQAQLIGLYGRSH
ncbi:MAG TPA: YbhB/YbcL family Raf kinase inhibitor-like protein [Patescibacteria group bacterium]|nr:YbhB/YbcL family Raf kinase inhibitor-like protein [Patescibacteria group bacterium]